MVENCLERRSAGWRPGEHPRPRRAVRAPLRHPDGTEAGLGPLRGLRQGAGQRGPEQDGARGRQSTGPRGAAARRPGRGREACGADGRRGSAAQGGRARARARARGNIGAGRRSARSRCLRETPPHVSAWARLKKVIPLGPLLPTFAKHMYSGRRNGARCFARGEANEGRTSYVKR
jgi:hypothetical protein